MLKVYAYAGCTTCRNALKYLKSHGIEHEVRPIREQPPSVAELKRALKAVGDVKKLFNTSGQDYRQQNLKERLPELSSAEALELLASNGNLIKRPFAVDTAICLVGFRADEWHAALS